MTYESVRMITLDVGTAGADIPKRRFVSYGDNAGTARLQLPSVAGNPLDILGVSMEPYVDADHDAGNASSHIGVGVIDGGIMEVQAGSALVPGNRVIAGTDGKAYASTTSAAANTPAGVYQEIGIVVGDASIAIDEIVTIATFRGTTVTTV